MFVPAVNGCLMQTFFYFADKFKTELLSYHSQAQGHLEKQSGGFRFTHVEVWATVGLSANQMLEKIQEAGVSAEKYCLISRSVACPVTYHLKIEHPE